MGATHYTQYKCDADRCSATTTWNYCNLPPDWTSIDMASHNLSDNKGRRYFCSEHRVIVLAISKTERNAAVETLVEIARNL